MKLSSLLPLILCVVMDGMTKNEAQPFPPSQISGVSRDPSSAIRSAVQRNECALPSERSLCREGFIEMCLSAVCYDSDYVCKRLSFEERGFLALCRVFAGFQKMQNCDCLLCPAWGGLFDRTGAGQCYGGKGIDVAEPVRGGCEAGGCCNPTRPLCELETHFFFMSLAYGIQEGSFFRCSSFDYFGPDHGCEFLTDGMSNDAIVCDNADITDSDGGRWNFCDITFSGTNDAIDIFREALAFSPSFAEEVTYGDGRDAVSFKPFKVFQLLGEGDPSDPTDGIIDIAFQRASDKGCFTREGAAVHLVGHSLGASLANIFALKLAGHYPNVHVKMTTMGEPATFVEPLTGRASTIQAWTNKSRYINGRVLPRSTIFNKLPYFPIQRQYGLYQDYCPIAQLIPGGFVGENSETSIFFMCEVLEGDELVYSINGPEGCAAGNTRVLDGFPKFPHEGGIDFLGGHPVADAIGDLQDFLESNNLHGLADAIDFVDIISAVGDGDLVEDFLQVIDLHFIRRSMHLLGKLYRDGQDCSASRTVVKL